MFQFCLSSLNGLISFVVVVTNKLCVVTKLQSAECYIKVCSKVFTESEGLCNRDFQVI